MRHGFVVKVHSLRRGAAEAMELVVHGDQKTSRVVGRRVDELPAIPGATLAVIVRAADKPETIGYEGLFTLVQKPRAQVIMARKNEVIKTGDHVIVFCLNKRVIKEVEQLFQVKAGFL